jgi:ketosteroid isomerase-like protein
MRTGTINAHTDSTTRTPVEVARALYGAFAAGDLDSLQSHLADDVVLHVPGHQPLSGDHHGPGGFVQFILASRAATEDGERLELVDILGGGGYAAGYCRITGERADRQPLDNLTVHIMRIEGGLVREVWFHNWDQDNVDQFWS